jgi:hypothetical protein
MDELYGTLKYVWWAEALFWVAFRRFADPPPVPREWWQFASDRAARDSLLLEEYGRKQGRLELAEVFLLEKARDGKVRVLGFHQQALEATNSNPNHENKVSDIAEVPTLVPIEFFTKPFDPPSQESNCLSNDQEAFHDPIVVVDDLLHEFWGTPQEIDFAEADLRQQTAGTEPTKDPPSFPSNLGARRRRGTGRPRELDWPGFAIELFRRYLANALPVRRAECENQMLAWCSEQWPRGEPAVSMVRPWVASFYNEFMTDGGTDRPRGVEKTADT